MCPLFYALWDSGTGGTAMIIRDREQRIAEARRLHEEGLSVRQVAAQLGMSKSQVARDLVAVPRASRTNDTTTAETSPPGPLEAHDSDLWERMNQFSVGQLARLAEQGSVPASVQLERISNERRREAMLKRCEGHVDKREVEQALGELWRLMTTQVGDSLPRRLVLDFGLPYAGVKRVIDEHLQDIADQINKQSEQEALAA